MTVKLNDRNLVVLCDWLHIYCVSVRWTQYAVKYLLLHPGTLNVNVVCKQKTLVYISVRVCLCISVSTVCLFDSCNLC